MNDMALMRLLRGWLTAVRGTVLAALLIPAAFLGMHLLGQGDVRELGYTLLLVGFGLLYGGARSFLRYARRQLRLWDALAHLPPEADALPPGRSEPERCYHALACAYQTAQRKALTREAQAERERLDYFTLWVHQIKTPISALDLMAQSAEPVSHELLRQEAFKIGQYADMALGYQRLQTLTNDLALTDVPLYPLCAALIKRLRPLFLYRRIRLVMEPFSGNALSDPKWLGMAVAQALTNALKYTPEGGCITVALAQPLVLTVRDTGPGIPACDLPRVFECGFTGGAGRMGREPEKSTGIGLYLCKQAMDKLGHRVRVDCPAGGGTRVTFDLRREGFEAFS
jgi:hypothetical protein